jgi:uncharacterized spore protein YtfJ
MSEGFEKINASVIESNQQAAETIQRLADVTQPNAVFKAPVQVGDHVVITANEVSVGMGIGFGSGGGTDEAGESGSGGGGGGGGASMGRPVAAIIISPDGVRVEPVVDVTKIAIAFFTALGAIFVAARRIRRVSEELT